MKKLLVLIGLVLFFSSCGMKRKMISQKTYKWGDKMVTKKEHDSLLYHHTYEFILKYSEENK